MVVRRYNILKYMYMCVYVMQFYCTFDIFKEWINMMSAVLKVENPDPTLEKQTEAGSDFFSTK